MKRQKRTAVIICLSFLLGLGAVSSSLGADYAAKKGLAFYEEHLTSLVRQTLALPASEKGQREILNRLFQMKFSEAERLFEFCADTGEAKKKIAQLYNLKAVQDHEAGNWVQAHYALKDARTWHQGAGQQRLQIGEKQVDMDAFSRELEAETQGLGGKVTFLIKKFPEDKMFHPDKVVLEQRKGDESAVAETGVSGEPPNHSYAYPGTEIQATKTVAPTKDDKEFLRDRFSKALYKYFYDPVKANAMFTLFLPSGDYHLFEKDFAIQPEEFTVAGKDAKVMIQPGSWFSLKFSDQVHPVNISLSRKRHQWQDLDHVPFGRYRIRVDHRGFTYPVVEVTFLRQGDDMENYEKAMSYRPEKFVVVDDRGSCTLALQPRSTGQKFRHVLLGY